MLKVTTILMLLSATTASGETHGVLNPEEMTIYRMVDNARKGQTDMVTCATGYYITKSGRHEMARELFELCAESGYTGAMTWMSQLDNNGLGAPYDPRAAAQWDKRAADAGDPVGMFNHGVDLLRGHGIAPDQELGRKMVDEAAKSGLPIARRLQSAEYDLDEVTPDADNWKFGLMY